jgi:phosphonate transport system substrate-binding protein
VRYSRIAGIFTAVVLLLTCLPAFTQDALILGIYPMFNARTAIQLFSPIARSIEDATGRRVELVTAPNQDSFSERLAEGRYDIVYLCNACYLRAREQIGLRALANGYPDFRGVVMVRADSDIRRLEDLRGRRVLAVAPHSLAGYLFLRNELADLGMREGEDYSVEFNDNIEALPFLVINGSFDAVSFSEDIYFRTAIYEETSSQLRILAQSIPIPQFPFAVSPWVDGELADSIRRAIIDFDGDSEEERIVLRRLRLEGFKAMDDEGFAEFAELYEKIRNSAP